MRLARLSAGRVGERGRPTTSTTRASRRNKRTHESASLQVGSSGWELKVQPAANPALTGPPSWLGSGFATNVARVSVCGLSCGCLPANVPLSARPPNWAGVGFRIHGLLDARAAGRRPPRPRWRDDSEADLWDLAVDWLVTHFGERVRLLGRLAFIA